MSKPSFDISIVTYNSSRWIDGFFKSLLAQNFPLADVNLFVRDNGSIDDTISKLNKFKENIESIFKSVNIEIGDNIGFGRGHNSNLEKSQSQFILVTNIDLEFEANTLVTLLKEASNDSLDVASWECRQKPFEHPKDYNPVTGETLWSSSACVLLRVSAMRAIGGYEQMLFMYGEDVELSYRLRDSGYKLKYVPKASVWHHTYEEAAQFKPLQFLGSTLANVLLRCRYGGKADIFQGFAMYLGLFLLRPQFPGQRKALIKQGIRLLSLAPRFLKTRRKSNQEFPFRMWDYVMAREGAFHPYPAVGLSQSPLVSVLVRTIPGNSGKLAESLASIAGQTYSRIHLVVVEDGGNSAQAQVEDCEKRAVFEKVTYLPLPKGGRCAAGNAALASAEGELICFLDDDDLFYADHLEVLVAAWSEKPQLGAVYGLSYEVKTEVISQNPWVYRDLNHSLIYRQAFSRSLLWHHNYMPIQTVLFQRSLYQKYGGFDPELDNLEDWNLWVRYSMEHDFMMVPKVTSLYRVPAENNKAVERQTVLDDYYAIAQAKHSQLKIEISPPEILKIAEQLSKELYILAIPAALPKRLILKVPVLKSLYHSAKKFWNLLRQIRNR